MVGETLCGDTLMNVGQDDTIGEHASVSFLNSSVPCFGQSTVVAETNVNWLYVSMGVVAGVLTLFFPCGIFYDVLGKKNLVELEEASNNEVNTNVTEADQAQNLRDMIVVRKVPEISL